MQYFLLIVGILFSMLAHGQRVYRNDFLTIGAGARDMALAGSVVANVSDETATFLNPAGLQALQTKHSAGLMHAEYFAGLSKYDFGSFAYKPNDSAAIALSLVRMGTDNIPNTLDLLDENGNVDYDRISYFSTADYAFFLAYAQKSRLSNLAYGLQAKIIYRHLGEFATAFGFGFDAGIQYRFGNWQAGAMLKDATSTFNAWFFDTSALEDVFLATGNRLPQDTVEFSVPQLNTGLARRFNFKQEFSLLAEIGITYTFDGQRHALISNRRMAISPQAGVEGSYNNMFFLRAGAGKFSRLQGFDSETIAFEPAIGLGIKLYGFRIDYALSNIANASGALYSNIFSLAYEFD